MKKAVLKLALVLRRFYWMVFRPQTRGVRAIIANGSGRIVLVWHQYQEGWFLPGGKTRKGETDEQALKRELMEELGISFSSPATLLGTYTNNQEYKRDTICVFVIHTDKQPTKRHYELEKFGYFDPAELPDGTSPGTRKRISEWKTGQSVTGNW